jgi:tetratricopeptide (TPR) repeat protein
MLAVGQGKPEFHLYLGKAFLAQDNTAKALEEFRAAAVAAPNLPLIHYFLGRTHLEQRDYAQAESELRQQLATDPSFAYSYEDLGLLYQQQNQPAQAEPFFRQAVERNNTLVNSWYGLASLYRDSADFPKALDMLDHAVKLAPESASIHFARGQVLQKLGRADEAKQEFALTAQLHKSSSDRLLQDPLGSKTADAETAAPQ